MNRSYLKQTLEVLLALIGLIALTPAADAQENQNARSSKTTLKSPDGRLAISFEIAPPSATESQSSAEKADKSPRLVYSITFNDKPVIDASALRLELANQAALGPNLHIVKTTPSSIDETYQLVAGKTKSARNHCNTLLVELEEDGADRRKIQIEARAFDDAIAFRYVVPKQPSLSEYKLTKEATEFRIHTDATSYAQVLPNYRSMYESEYIKLPLERVEQPRRCGQ